MKTRTLVSLLLILLLISIVYLSQQSKPLAQVLGIPPHPITSDSVILHKSKIYSLINNHRSKQGLSKLNISTKLEKSAELKLDHMIEEDCWSHICAEIVPWDFMRQASYDYIYAGENLAEGFSKDEDIIEAWLKSPKHRENIEHPSFLEMGIAIECTIGYQKSKYNCIVANHFGTPQ